MADVGAPELAAFLAERVGTARVVEVRPGEKAPIGSGDLEDAVVLSRTSLRALRRSPDAVHWLCEASTRAPFVVVAADADPTPRFHLRRGRRGPTAADTLRNAGIDGLLSGRCAGPDGTEVVVTGLHARRPQPQRELRAAALIHVHNDGDILGEVIDHLVAEGIEVHIFDNWSTDGSWDVAQGYAERGRVVHLERFPGDGPPTSQLWTDQLARSSAYAAGLDVDWITHHDADEIRMSPWPGVRLVDALAAADDLGYNAVDFTVIDFRFLRDGVPAFAPFEQSMTHFEFGRRPGHFLQIKAWKNLGQVELAESGGHEAIFEGRRVFPLKFLLKHYPLRSVEQAQRKIFVDRPGRQAEERAERGWHTQYDQFREGGEEVGWDADQLVEWDDQRFASEFLIERLTGLGLSDSDAAADAPPPPSAFDEVDSVAPVVETPDEFASAPRRDVPSVRRIGGGVPYLDGAETQLLEVMRRASDVSSGSDELDGHIVDWASRYHLSHQRANLLRVLRFDPGARVLDIGAGTGILARFLGEQGVQVLALEGSMERARVAAVRCADLPNVDVVCGTIDDLDDDQRFDLITVIGVLEYSAATIGGGKGPGHLLSAVRSHLEPNGAVALAIENQLGLKYLLGGAEDHHGVPWVGLEDYPGPAGACTWSRRELHSLLAAAGLGSQQWLYPFPDYKLPSAVLHERIYDEPDSEELVDQILRRPVAFLDAQPARIADSAAALRVFTRAGIGPDVANSFFVIAGETAAGVDALVADDVLAWIDGGHRRSLWRRHRVLTSDRRLVLTGSSACRAEGWLTQDPGKTRPFEPGQTVAQLLEAAIRRHDLAGTRAVLRLWWDELQARSQPASADGRPAGGSHPFVGSGSARVLPDDHLDVTPANFVVRDDTLVLIDSEWCVDTPVDMELVTIRALWMVSHEIVTSGISHPWGDRASVAEVFDHLASMIDLKVTPEAFQAFETAEMSLQQLVVGAEGYLREGWLNGERRGIDDRLDRQMAEDAERFRTAHRALEESHRRLLDQYQVAQADRVEFEGQCLHYEGLVAARDAEIAHLSSARGAVAQVARGLLRRGRSRR